MMAVSVMVFRGPEARDFGRGALIFVASKLIREPILLALAG